MPLRFLSPIPPPDELPGSSIYVNYSSISNPADRAFVSTHCYDLTSYSYNSRYSFDTRPFPSYRVHLFTSDEFVPGQQQNDQHLRRSLDGTEGIIEDLAGKE